METAVKENPHAELDALIESFGIEYKADSRKGEAIYRHCLEIGLNLRLMLGNDGLVKLQEAFQDY